MATYTGWHHARDPPRRPVPTLHMYAPLCRAGSDGWFYPQHAAENASLREIIHDGFLHPKDNK